ncbi:GNAT family N-acetyltransferase [Dietzia maris]|uniref:GNAT family N-acetyltransferase n=1 Tax=Dietzia maris TaxID=37915 RepID=UPI00104ED086|nr:GNAT family N-acetyltransferase [Dietzia sp. SLG510A3-40A3]MBB1009315.1 GNAT family N-acetyltransferase [Dietzia sp. SLG510A3-3B2-2]
MDTVITRLDAADFRDRLPEALGVYVDAMGYPPQVVRSRAAAWMEHSYRDGWSGVAAFEAPRRRLLGQTRGKLVAICYGYHGAPGQWWYDQVSRGLRDRDRELPPDYVELTELHVSPGLQGRGIGATLVRTFLADRPESTVLLSTPEVDGEDNAAWRLYRSLGFTDVLRSYRFQGDARPFAVLARSLPLAENGDRT